MKRKKNVTFPAPALVLLGLAFLLYIFSLRVYSHGFWSGFGIIVLAGAGLYLLYWSGLFPKKLIAVVLGLIISAIVLVRVLSNLIALLFFGATLLVPILLIAGAFLLGKLLK